MWPILFERRFLTIVQVDEPTKVWQDDRGAVWAVPLLDIRGGSHKPLYTTYQEAYDAWVGFRQFAARPAEKRGFHVWRMRELERTEGE